MSHWQHRLERKLIEIQGIGGILKDVDPVRSGLEVFSRARRRWTLGMQTYALATALAPVPRAPAEGEMDPPRRTQAGLLIMLEAVRFCRIKSLQMHEQQQQQDTERKQFQPSEVVPEYTVEVEAVVNAYFGRLLSAMEDHSSRLEEQHYWGRRKALSAACGEPSPSLGHVGADRNAFIADLSARRIADTEVKTGLLFDRPGPSMS